MDHSNCIQMEYEQETLIKSISNNKHIILKMSDELLIVIIILLIDYKIISIIFIHYKYYLLKKGFIFTNFF